MAMFKQIFNSLFADNSTPPPSSGQEITFDPSQFNVPIIGYNIPETLQKQLKSVGFPSIGFTNDIAIIHEKNKSKNDIVILFPIRFQNMTAKEFVKSLRDENPTLSTQLVVVSDKFNKEDLISLLRQRINGILILPLTKEMLFNVFLKLNFIPEKLKA